MNAIIPPVRAILFSRAPVSQRYREAFSQASSGSNGHGVLDVTFAESSGGVFDKITLETFDAVFLSASLPMSDLNAVIDFCSGRFRFLPLFGLAELEDEREELTRSYPALRSVFSVDAFFAREFQSLFQSYIAEKNILLRLHGQQENLHVLIQRSANGMLVTDKQNTILFLNIAAMALLEKSFPSLIGAKVDFPLTCGRPIEYELRNLDGSISTLEVYVTETFWFSAPAYFISLNNISKKKSLEHFLEERVKERSSVLGPRLSFRSTRIYGSLCSDLRW